MDRKQLIVGLTVVGLLMQSSLCSWSRAGTKDDVVVKTDFPLPENQQWAIEESYLLWKPYMQNMWYGTKQKFETSGINTETKLKVKNPEFEWSSGVRMGITRYLANHDAWDVNLTGTFFYSTTKDKTRGDPSKGLFFNELITLNPQLGVDKGEFNWRFNYWTLDLGVGRLFKMTQHISFHPYFGLRGSWQYQKSHITSEDVPSGQVVKGINENDFWGVGPRFGTHFAYCFESKFSFLANFAASLMAGRQKLKENSNLITSIPSFINKLRSRDSLSVIRTNLEGMIGLGWERWLRNGTVRIAPSVAFEGSLWFAMNQLYSTSNSINNPGTRRTGNLGLMGITFDLQVDF